MTRRELGRRLIHAGLGFGAFLVPILGWQALLGLCIAAALGNAFLLPRIRASKWLCRDDQDGGRRGLILYPISVGLLALLFREQPGPIQAGWLALALGDGLAPLAGELFPIPRWPWNRRKSLTASAVSYGLAGLAMLTVISWPAAIVASVTGGLAESLPSPSEDNLAVPLGAAVAAYLANGAAA